MRRKIWDFRKRSSQPKAIDFDAQKTTNLCLSIDKNKVELGEENLLTVSLLRAAKIGDKLRYQSIIYEVSKVEETHIDKERKGFVFQKLIVKRFE